MNHHHCLHRPGNQQNNEGQISGASTKASAGVKNSIFDDKVKGGPTTASAGVKSGDTTKVKGVKPSPHFAKSSSGATSSQNPQGSSSSSQPTHTAHSKIDGKSKAWWAKQNIQQIKAQCEMRGKRFTDVETKGEKGSYGNAPTPKFKKQDYLNTLYKLLGI